MTVQNLGFSEALRAAWLLSPQGDRSWLIERRRGDYLKYSHELRRYFTKKDTIVSPSKMAPEVPCYWLDANDWGLTLI